MGIKEIVCIGILGNWGEASIRTKTLWIKDVYLRLILDGIKTVEVRVAYSNIARLQPGDRLLLNGQHPYRVEQVKRYASFEDLLTGEPRCMALPDKPERWLF